MTEIKSIYNTQKEFFNSKKTRSIKYRKQSLRKLSAIINKHEKAIYEALIKDLGKSKYESFEILLLVGLNE